MKRFIVSGLMAICCALAVPMVSAAAEQAVAAAAVTQVVNVNTATVQELQQLPGIGKAIAQRIVEFREQGGHFKTPDDLMQVKGIGQKTMEHIRPMVAVK